MNNKADHMKYKEGSKRAFRPNEWYINKKEEREVNTFLAGSKGGVPNNQTPIFSRPNQRGASFDPPPVPIEKAGKVKRDNSKPKRKGMSTSVGLMNTGPLRDISPM